ncbi:hypothetical protein N9M66_00695 [Litoreibacter sp.]|nr:hypothetical protein [Litoreibacter sp.]
MKQDRQLVGKLRHLKSAADVLCQADEVKMAAAAEKVRRIEAQIYELRKQLTTPLGTEQGTQEIFVTARHRVWIERGLRALNLELSQAAAQRELAKDTLARTSGRKEVLHKLIKKQIRYPAG